MDIKINMDEVNAKRDFFKKESEIKVNFAAPGNKEMVYKFEKGMDLKMAVVHSISAVDMQRLAFRINDRLEEVGLYNYNRKKHCKILVEACSEQSKYIKKNEDTALYDMYTTGFPYYRKEFKDEGYDVFKILQDLWTKECGDPIECIYQRYDAALLESNVKNHSLVAELYTLIALHRILKAVFSKIERSVKIVEKNFSENPLFRYPVLDKIHMCAVSILREIPREDVSVSEEVKIDISEMCKKAVMDLSNDRYAECVNDIIQGLTLDYIEFCLAKMLVEDREGGVNEVVEREMKDILGEELYDNVIAKLRGVNLEDDFDIIDVMHAIPDADEGEPLYDARTILLGRYPYSEPKVKTINQE